MKIAERFGLDPEEAAQILKDIGYEVVSCDQAEEAVEKAIGRFAKTIAIKCDLSETCPYFDSTRFAR